MKSTITTIKITNIKMAVNFWRASLLFIEPINLLAESVIPEYSAA